MGDNQPGTPNVTASSTPTTTPAEAPIKCNTATPFINLFTKIHDGKSNARSSQQFTTVAAAAEVERLITPERRPLEYLAREEETKEEVHASLMDLFGQRLKSDKSSELTKDIDQLLLEWPSDEFHQQTLSLIPNTQSDFKPCFFKYPKDTTLEANSLNF